MTESCPKKTNIAEISPHLICALCGGYLIDATTIVECLHSFCKTCIVRYLESSKYCPICEVLVHKTRPLQNIRLDHTLQDIVYKLVPGLFQSEMKRRREFYKDFPTIKSAKVRQEQQRHRIIYSADEQFSISLEFCPNGRIRRTSGRRSRRDSKQQVPERRYLRVPGATTMALLKKFMRLKFALPSKYKVDIFHSKGPLRDHYSMIDVAYIYSWRREGVLQLYYSVYREPDPIPEITITEVKTENTQELADESAQKADDMRPSTLFNKAALLGKNTVVKDIHDLSPLELIATVANDISIQESRGQKRKTDDAQLYENEDETCSTENGQLQKSIERAIDLCSSNQGSPGSASGSFSIASAPSTVDRRTVCHATLLQSNTSQNCGIQSASPLKAKIDRLNKVNSLQGSLPKSVVKDKPRKTDTASQCDPRPKKHKSDSHGHSKSGSKSQNFVKETKSVTSSNSNEKKQNNTKSDVKSSDKSVSDKTNGVTGLDKNITLTNSSKAIKDNEISPLKCVEPVVNTVHQKEPPSQSTHDNTHRSKTTNGDSSATVKSDKTNSKLTNVSTIPVTSSAPKYVSLPSKHNLNTSKAPSASNSLNSLTATTKNSGQSTPVKSNGAQVKTTTLSQQNTITTPAPSSQIVNKTTTAVKSSGKADNGAEVPSKSSEFAKTAVQINGHLSDTEHAQTAEKSSSDTNTETK